MRERLTTRTESSALPNNDHKFGYLPSLDGWRAIAILGVILYHSTLHTAGIFSTAWAWRYGHLGVDVFFAISGLLITSKLLEEEKRSGRIYLPHFYLRRAFRILPAAIVYLTAIACLSGLGLIYVSRMEWFASLFFYRNYSSLYHIERGLGYPWFTTHFWSLSLEEHFYFLLPALLVLTRRKARLASLLAIILAVIVHRQSALAHREWFTIVFHTDIRLDALLIPALFAVVSRSERFGEPFNALIRRWHFVFVLVFFLALQLPESSGLRMTAIEIALPGIVLGTVLKPESLGTGLLEWRPLRWIGRISYSLYLWQELFFTQRFYLWRPLGRLETWPLNLLLTFLTATLSYYVVERPLVRLGHRLTSGRSK